MRAICQAMTNPAGGCPRPSRASLKLLLKTVAGWIPASTTLCCITAIARRNAYIGISSAGNLGSNAAKGGWVLRTDSVGLAALHVWKRAQITIMRPRVGPVHEGDGPSGGIARLCPQRWH